MYMWEMAEIFQKRIKYVVNELDLWEMAQIYGNDLIISQTA